MQIGTPIAAPVEVRLSGSDEALFDIADAVKARLRAHPGARRVTDDWGPRSKKLLVDVDQLRARRAGVSNQDIAISLQAALSGFETTQYRSDDAAIPVMFRSIVADGAVPVLTRAPCPPHAGGGADGRDACRAHPGPQLDRGREDVGGRRRRPDEGGVEWDLQS